jgi:hypothetical protein
VKWALSSSLTMPLCLGTIVLLQLNETLTGTTSSCIKPNTEDGRNKE